VRPSYKLAVLTAVASVVLLLAVVMTTSFIQQAMLCSQLNDQYVKMLGNGTDRDRLPHYWRNLAVDAQRRYQQDCRDIFWLFHFPTMPELPTLELGS
jgi:hypothetical protein